MRVEREKERMGSARKGSEMRQTVGKQLHQWSGAWLGEARKQYSTVWRIVRAGVSKVVYR